MIASSFYKKRAVQASLHPIIYRPKKHEADERHQESDEGRKFIKVCCMFSHFSLLRGPAAYYDFNAALSGLQCSNFN
ncbi:MAG: hypothetical protein ACKOB7_10300, partial [Methylocystis sp.]